MKNTNPEDLVLVGRDSVVPQSPACIEMKFENLLNDLRNTTKFLEKQKVLLNYDSPQLRDLLRWAYDPFILFNVSLKNSEVPSSSNYDIGEIFEKVTSVLRFCENSKSSKQNREKINKLLSELNSGSQELLICTLNKNWKAGINAKTVNKIFDGLISRFNVQLAETYDPNKESHYRQTYNFSYKLDGLRCVALRDKKNPIWKLYSRKGKEFLTVDHIKPNLETLYRSNGWTFFDGELYKHGLKFEEIQGPVMAFTKGQVSHMEYHVFAVGDSEKFLASSEPEHVTIPWSTCIDDDSCIKFVNKGVIKSENIEDALEIAFEKGYEGIVLRDPEMPYDYKRSSALLKLKRSLSEHEAGETISDCVVTNVEYNEAFPVVEDGEIKTEFLLSRIWVEQDSNIKCKVGSGFDLNFRKYYTKKPEELLGKIVEIKHQGYGANGRMRFPRLWRIREDL